MSSDNWVLRWVLRSSWKTQMPWSHYNYFLFSDIFIYLLFLNTQKKSLKYSSDFINIIKRSISQKIVFRNEKIKKICTEIGAHTWNQKMYFCHSWAQSPFIWAQWVVMSNSWECFKKMVTRISATEHFFLIFNDFVLLWSIICHHESFIFEGFFIYFLLNLLR